MLISHQKLQSEFLHWLPGYNYYKNEIAIRESLPLVDPIWESQNRKLKSRQVSREEFGMSENDFIFQDDVQRLLGVTSINEIAQVKLDEANGRIKALNNDIAILKIKYNKIESEYKIQLNEVYLKGNRILELNDIIQRHVETEHKYKEMERDWIDRENAYSIAKRKTIREDNCKFVQTDEIEGFLSMVDEAKDYTKSKQKAKKFDDEVLNLMLMKKIEN